MMSGQGMREMYRRTDLGARWSMPGVANLTPDRGWRNDTTRMTTNGSGVRLDDAFSPRCLKVHVNGREHYLSLTDSAGPPHMIDFTAP